MTPWTDILDKLLWTSIGFALGVIWSEIKDEAVVWFRQFFR